MKFGLSFFELEQLERMVLAPLKAAGARLFLFGSRARGDHSRFSDVDILVEGNALDATLARVREDIEESRFPYKVDLVKADRLAASYVSGVAKDRVPL